jgi:RND family efflux transporter MFP subunit
MPKFLTRAQVIGVVLVASVLTARCSPSPHETRASEQPALSVKTAPVALGEGVGTYEAGGVVQARTTAVITARMLAAVLDVRVAPGDRVKAGDLLVLLDGRDLGATAASARSAAVGAEQGLTAAAAEARAADAALVLARATYDRVSALQTRRSATPQELDEATAALRAAEARVAGAAARSAQAASGVESARAASEAAGTLESFTRLTAPFDGVVTAKMVDVGNMASPGLPLVRVEDTRGFQLEVRVDESRAGALLVDAVVPVVLDGSSGTDAVTLQGRVAEVSRAVDADTRAVLVKIALPQTPGVRSGMFGRARLPGAARRALTVPESALVRRGQVTSTFVVEDGVARLRLVSVRGTEVLAGLGEGDVVVLDPPAGLADGRRVTGGGR